MVVGDFYNELDTVIIGSGPGGYVAAIRASQLGQKVTVIEKDKIGGVCLNVGCIPSKALISAGSLYQDSINAQSMGINIKEIELDFTKMQAWKDNEVVNKLTSGVEMLLKKNKVTIIKGEAFFTSANTLRVITKDDAQSYQFNNAIIATGSHPSVIKGFKFGTRITDSTGILNLKEIPKHIVVVGGGYIGVELAQAYKSLGSEVSVLQRSNSILRTFDEDLAKVVIKQFEEDGIKIINNASNMEASEDKEKATVKYQLEGKDYEIEADYVLVSVGRTPNTTNIGLEAIGIKLDKNNQIIINDQCKTNIDNIYAIGDIVKGLPLAHKASYEGEVAAKVISKQKVKIDYQAIPAVCFSHPEIAVVGLSKNQAKIDNIKVKVSNFPFSANGRALSLNKVKGFIQLLSDENTNALLGAQIVGVNASEMIAEMSIALEANMSVEDIALTIHSHPSLSETILDAAKVAAGLPIHI